MGFELGALSTQAQTLHTHAERTELTAELNSFAEQDAQPTFQLLL